MTEILAMVGTGAALITSVRELAERSTIIATSAVGRLDVVDVCATTGGLLLPPPHDAMSVSPINMIAVNIPALAFIPASCKLELNIDTYELIVI